jgi:hypothetical protein
MDISRLKFRIHQRQKKKREGGRNNIQTVVLDKWREATDELTARVLRVQSLLQWQIHYGSFQIVL